MNFAKHFMLFVVVIATASAVSFVTTSKPAKDDSDKAAVTTDGQPKITVRCQLLMLDADYFEVYSYSLPQKPAVHQYVLRDIETFFLFQSRNQVKPAWHSIPTTVTTSIHDDVAIDGEHYMVNLSWRQSDDPATNELRISVPAKSRFGLDTPVTVAVPDGGSVILRTSKPAGSEKSAFIWLLAGRDDDGEHK